MTATLCFPVIFFCIIIDVFDFLCLKSRRETKLDLHETKLVYGMGMGLYKQQNKDYVNIVDINNSLSLFIIFFLNNRSELINCTVVP